MSSRDSLRVRSDPRAKELEFLRREARHLAKRALGIDLPSALVDRYVEANQALLADTGGRPGPLADALREAIQAGVDVEALEFALRLSQRRNLLTQKLHVLAYIVETDPTYVSLFVNDRRSRVRAYIILAGHALRAAWKYARGRWLLRNARSAGA